MRIAAIAASVIGLLLTIVPACMVFAGALSWQAHAHLMTAGMLLWFVTAPVWFKE
jgi:hypothetical protein